MACISILRREPTPPKIVSIFVVAEYVSAVAATIAIGMHMYRLGEVAGSKVIKALAIVDLLTLAINAGVLKLGTVDALKLYTTLWIFTGFEFWRAASHLQTRKDQQTSSK